MTGRMCATNLFFLLAEEHRKGFGSSAHLGIFMYLKTALGLRKKSGAVSLFVLLYLLYHLALVAKAERRPPLEIGRKQCKKNDLLDFVFHASCISRYCVQACILATSFKGRDISRAMQMPRNNSIHVQVNAYNLQSPFAMLSRKKMCHTPPTHATS